MEDDITDRLFSDAERKNLERIQKRGEKIFNILDKAISDEVRDGGPIDSASHWAAIATLVAKTVMVQELQSGRKDLFDKLVLQMVESARRVYDGGYNLNES